MRDGWRETTLGEVADTLLGKTLARGGSSVEGGQPYLRNVNVQWGRVSDNALNEMIFSEAERELYELKAGDILMCEGGEVGRLALLKEDLPGVYFQNALHRVRASAGDEPGFIALALEHLVRSGGLEGLVRQVTIAHLNQRTLRQLPIALPPLGEQRRIVDLIAAVDDAVDAAEAEVRETEALVEATRDLRIWSADVGLTPLSKVVRVVGGLVAPVGDAAMLPHIGTDRIESVTGRLVGVQTAAEDQVTSGKFLHESDTVIYSKIRPNLRKVAIPSWRGLCSADAYPMLPLGGGNLSFLRHLLVSRPFTDAAVARSGRTKMPKINRTELMSIDVPDIEPDEQASIAADLDSMRDAADAARATAESLRTLRSNLLTVLLSGEHEIPSSYDALLGEVA